MGYLYYVLKDVLPKLLIVKVTLSIDVFSSTVRLFKKTFFLSYLIVKGSEQ
jgi:hypothetical protein